MGYMEVGIGKAEWGIGKAEKGNRRNGLGRLAPFEKTNIFSLFNRLTALADAELLIDVFQVCFDGFG